MARGSTSGNGTSNVLFAKIKADKEKKEIWFQLTKGIGDKKYETLPSKDKFLSGTLKKMEMFDYMWKEELIKGVKFHIEDKESDETYILSISFSNILRNILNSLASVPIIDHLYLSVYFNDAGFETVSVKINHQKGEWKYPIKDLNAMNIEVKHPTTGKLIATDRSAQDAFLTKEVVVPLIAKLGGNDSEDSGTTAWSGAPASASQEESDLPF